jgi:hypothetical protein
MHAIYPARHIKWHLATCRLWSFSWRNFLHLPVTFFLLCPNVLEVSYSFKSKLFPAGNRILLVQSEGSRKRRLLDCSGECDILPKVSLLTAVSYRMYRCWQLYPIEGIVADSDIRLRCVLKLDTVTFFLKQLSCVFYLACSCFQILATATQRGVSIRIGIGVWGRGGVVDSVFATWTALRPVEFCPLRGFPVTNICMQF